MQVTSFPSTDAALHAACKLLLSSPSVAPRGVATREATGVAFRITDPRARWVTNSARRWSAAYAIGEFCWHMSGSDDLAFIAYYSQRWHDILGTGGPVEGSCYGKRMLATGPDGRSQWLRVAELLRKDPETRRAVISFWNPGSELLSDRDVPCFSSLQFLVRGGLLHAIGHMRSNDVIWGFANDIFLMTMLQEMMANMLSLDVGWYQHSVASLHLYGTHVEKAHAIVDAGVGQATDARMARMDNVQAIPAFLETERRIRTRSLLAPHVSVELPRYWCELADPLLAYAQRVAVAASTTEREQ